MRRVPQAPEVSRAMGKGRASPRICEVELCRACSPIFWMALKYTSAASDRAAWRRGGVQTQPLLCVLPTSHSGGLSFGQESVGGSGRGGGGRGKGCLGRMCVCGVVLATGEAAGVGGAGGLSLGGRTLARLSWVGVQASVCVRRRVWAGVLGGSGVEAQSGGGVVWVQVAGARTLKS